MAHLKLVKSLDKSPKQSGLSTKSSTPDTSPVVGSRCTVQVSANRINIKPGLIANYTPSVKQSVIEPIECVNTSIKQGFFWHANFDENELAQLGFPSDPDCPPHIQPLPSGSRLNANRAILQSSKLIGPDMITMANQATLTVSPEFILHFHTAASTAKLGEIRLIDSSRFLTLKSGKTIPIMCTDPAEGQALFLNKDQHSAVKTQGFIQPQKSRETYVIRNSLQQELPNFFQNEEVQCVTVLEHITSFFMQKDVSDTESIWTPILNPISWGWSVKAEKIGSQWQLTRKKVMRPTQHQEGLQLPEWKTHIKEQTKEEWNCFLNKRNPAFSNTSTENGFNIADQNI